jgi:hypothetical protein
MPFCRACVPLLQQPSRFAFSAFAGDATTLERGSVRRKLGSCLTGINLLLQ